MTRQRHERHDGEDALRAFANEHGLLVERPSVVGAWFSDTLAEKAKKWVSGAPRNDVILAAGAIAGHHVHLRLVRGILFDFSVDIGAAEIPAGAELCLKPIGKSREDYYTGLVTDSANEEFNQHHCIRRVGEVAIEELAKLVPRRIPQWFSGQRIDGVLVSLGRKHLELTLPEGTRWRTNATKHELETLWQYAERFVEQGITDGVLA